MSTPKLPAGDYVADHKVPKFDLSEMTNAAPRFYELIGPWLSRREIVDELGGPVWDDDDKQWIVAHNPDGPIGMVAVRRGVVCSLYVASGARGQIVGTTMLLRLILRNDAKPLRAIATDASLSLFEACGFREVGNRGRFHRMVRK